MVKGEQATHGRFREFSEAIKRAVHVEELSGLAEIYRHSQGGQLLSRTTVRKLNGEEVVTETFSAGQWPARAWIIERRHPERYARRLTIANADGQPFSVQGIPGGSFDSDEFAEHRRRVEAIKLLTRQDRAELMRLSAKLKSIRKAMETDGGAGSDKGRLV
jgi:hypothetical protein